MVQPEFYTFRVKNVYPHSTDSYTQGLQYVDGVMWEGTGEWGESRLQKVDLESGAVETLVSMPRSEFGEGITVLGDKVYQLTWTNGVAHVYNLQGKKVKDFRYAGEGWGLTTDGTKLYMSDVLDVTVNSITTAKTQHLYIDGADAELMRGKRVLIVDDVISTGESLAAVEELVRLAGGEICGKMTILAEGDAQERDDLIYLEKLPLFNPDGTIME